MPDMLHARQRMVEQQVARRGVRDPHLLEAMRRVPREVFVPDHLREHAYGDTALPIAAGQTISQPYIVALMIEAAEVRPGDRVLDVGAGSGYAAAVVSRIADRVFAIERHRELAESATQRLCGLGYDNVTVRTGDGTGGWPEAAPFDAILVAAGGARIPDALKDQLAIGGRLVMPVGRSPYGQCLVKLTRRDETRFDREDLAAVSFVPLVGATGGGHDDPSTPHAITV